MGGGAEGSGSRDEQGQAGTEPGGEQRVRKQSVRVGRGKREGPASRGVVAVVVVQGEARGALMGVACCGMWEACEGALVRVRPQRY